MPDPKPKAKSAARPKQEQKRGSKKKAHYTDEEKKVILAQLAANGYNYSRTAKETGVARSTLIAWAENPPNTTDNDTEIDTLKKHLTESYLDKAKRAREVLLDRMIELAGSEKDLFKISGAFKTVADAAASEEVSSAVASRIRGHSAVPKSTPAQGTSSTGSGGSPATANA